MKLGRHSYGRTRGNISRGAVCWPFHDLLWLHEGRMRLRLLDSGQQITFASPGGVLILPGTRFDGEVLGGWTTCSVCHFEADPGEAPTGPGHMLPREDERPHLQAQIRLALHLQRRRPGETARRERLMASIVDGFERPGAVSKAEPVDRLDAAWAAVRANPAQFRTLADVAALMGLAESSFRAQHRDAFGDSAGAHLRSIRLARAEDLLAATGFSLAEIAAEVGYGHAETLIAAFRRASGVTPAVWRREANPFA